MELKPGYKQTDLGILPEEWAVEPLGGHATFRTGPFGSALHKSDYTSDGIPIVNPMHIVNGKVEPTPTMTVTEDAARKLSDFRLKAGEIVIGRRGDMGRCAVVREEYAGWLCGTGSMIIRPRGVDPAFLQRVLSSPRSVAAIEHASVGTTMVNLNQATLSELAIQFPPLPEQRAIATALRDVDALLRALDELTAKKRELKKAAMQQLLTGNVRLPGFSADWKLKCLGELVELSKVSVNPSLTPNVVYTHFSLPAFDAGQTPVVEPGALIGSSKFAVPQDGVLISKLNPRIPRVWAPHHVPARSVCSTEFLVLRPAEIERGFLKYLCLSPSVGSQMELHAIGTTGSHQRIQPNQALAIRVHVPSNPSEQIAIATVLSDIDAEIKALEGRSDKTRELKQAMIQQLLTGRTRLVTAQVAHA